jgi:hypothetical protein
MLNVSSQFRVSPCQIWRLDAFKYKHIQNMYLYREVLPNPYSRSLPSVFSILDSPIDDGKAAVVT